MSFTPAVPLAGSLGLSVDFAQTPVSTAGFTVESPGVTGLVADFSTDPPLTIQFAAETPLTAELAAAIVGPPGPTGPSGASLATYNETFLANTLWIVNHNLGRNPAAIVRSTGGDVVAADILHVTVNQLRVTFETAFAGSIYCI